MSFHQFAQRAEVKTALADRRREDGGKIGDANAYLGTLYVAAAVGLSRIV